MNIKRRKRIFLILTFLWMAVIFGFSVRPAAVSTQDSHKVGMMVGRIQIPEFEEWPKQRQISYAEKIDYPVRKMAHFAEYTVLGILILGAGMESISLKAAVCAWIFGTLYAVTDEVHQLFVSGRSGQVSDVILDSAGVLTGVLVGIFLYWCYRWGISGKQKNHEVEV